MTRMTTKTFKYFYLLFAVNVIVIRIDGWRARTRAHTMQGMQNEHKIVSLLSLSWSLLLPVFLVLRERKILHKGVNHMRETYIHANGMELKSSYSCITLPSPLVVYLFRSQSINVRWQFESYRKSNVAAVATVAILFYYYFHFTTTMNARAHTYSNLQEETFGIYAIRVNVAWIITG